MTFTETQPSIQLVHVHLTMKLKCTVSWHVFFCPLDKSDNHMLQFAWHLRFLLDKGLGFVCKSSKFKQTSIWQLDKSDNHGRLPRLSDSKIYLEMSRGARLVSHPGPWFSIKMSYQYRKSHFGDKTVLRASHFHNGISYIGKTISLHWISPLVYIDALWNFHALWNFRCEGTGDTTVLH